RTVESGELYRSGQLRGKHLAYVLESKRIRSVINLRGYSKTDTDLDRERNLSKAMGVKHVDISMSASRLPEPNELRKLINAFDVLPRPILVHCLGGSDRSGLASTLYMSIYKRMPLDQAQASQLTCRYGHISFGKAHAMDDFFSMYRQTAGNLSIREWILTRYPKIYLDSISRKSKRSAPIQPTDH
ncbi:MAG TPA: tyrosine-protein phosphatase, partial [Armatimonadota bacterium]